MGDTMKKKRTFRQYMAVFIITILVAFLSLGLIKQTSFYEKSDRKVFGFVSMIRYGLIDYPVQTASSIFKDVSKMWHVRYDNDYLRKQIAYSHQWQTRVNELENEINELKDVLGIQEVYTDMTLIPTKVKARSLEKWDQSFTIDSGSADGIDLGDGIISPYGLVGKVISVSEEEAVISTILANNDNSQVSVKIEISKGTYAQGILSSYDYNTDLFSVKLLDTSFGIAQEMKVTSSGLGGVYPAGLLVGQVDSIKQGSDTLGSIVYVKSNVNFNGLKYLSVVKNK